MVDPNIKKIDPMIKGTIKAFGYSEDEIEVYFALLEIGTSTAKDTSKRARMDLSKTTKILEALIDKKIVDKIIGGGYIRFRPVPFENIFVDRRPDPLQRDG